MIALRIDLIVNAQARMHTRRAELMNELGRVAAGRCTLHVTQSLSELDQLTARLAERGTDLVLLSGGDGTLMAGVTALARAFGRDAMPEVAPVPGGTAGTVARNWQLHGSPTRCLDRLLRGPRRRVQRPTLEVVCHGPTGTAEQRIGFIVGTGLVAQFFRIYYQRGAPGYRGSAALVARIFVESFFGGPLARQVLTPLPCSLSVNDVVMPPEAWSLVCCSVVKNLGIGMLVTYRGGDDALRPHLVATPMTPAQLGPRAPLVLAGRSLGGPHHVDELVEHFSLRFPDSGPFVLDGELLDARRVEVRAGPRLRVAMPG